MSALEVYWGNINTLSAILLIKSISWSIKAGRIREA
jgi:hypothetical protein